MSDRAETQPDPQATAWMRDFLVDRPFVDPIDICDYYRGAHPGTDLSNRVLTESYVAARVEHDEAQTQATPAVPSDEGPTDCIHCRQRVRRFGQTRRWCHDATGNVQCAK